MAKDVCKLSANPTIAQVRACARKCAKKTGRANWFGPGEMSYFNTRVSPGSKNVKTDGHGGAFFITSERPDSDFPWKWSIRHYNANACGITTVGKFQRFKSPAAAQRALKNISRRARMSVDLPDYSGRPRRRR